MAAENFDRVVQLLAQLLTELQQKADLTDTQPVTGGGGGTEYTEDAAAAADPLGTTQILVRQDTPATLVSANGDNVVQRGTNYGAAYTQIVTSAGAFVDSFGGAGGTSMTDDAAFTPATTLITPMGAEFDDTSPDSVDEGDGGAVRMSGNRNLYVRIRDNAGNERGLNVDASGRALVDASGVAVPVTDNSGSLTIDNAQLSVVGSGTEATAMRVTVATDSTGVISVDDNSASLTVDNAQLSVVGSGTEATAMRVTIATDSTGVLSVDDNSGSLTVDQGAAGTAWEVVGDVAADAAAPTNPVIVGGQTESMADSAPGTRMSADGDANKLACTDGALYVIPCGPQTWSYHENSSNALTDTSVHAAPGASLSLYVTDIVCSTGAATAMNIFFEEGSTTVLGPWYLEAVAGRGLALHFGTPKKITANTALTVTTSAAIAHSIDVTGYTAP